MDESNASSVERISAVSPMLIAITSLTTNQLSKWVAPFAKKFSETKSIKKII